MKSITKQSATAFLLVILTFLFTSCSENNTGNVNKANSNQKGLYQSLFDAAKAGVKYDNSIARINTKLVKSSTIQTDAVLSFYETWDDFNVVCSNLPKEDFEEARITYGQGFRVDPPLNSSTNNDFFLPGDILPGLEITTIGGWGSIALVAENYIYEMGNPSKCVFADYGDNYLILKFSGSNVYYVGMDIFSVWSSDNLIVEIYGVDGLIGTTTAYGNNTGSFWGVASNTAITEIHLISENGPFEGVDNIAFGTCILDVSIDIKPGSNPNSINCQNTNGNIPVAILSSSTFNSLNVDHATVRFQGASESHVDRDGVPTRHEEDVNGDGLTDLVLHFRFGATNLDCNSTAGNLTGQTYAGQQIRGSDAIRMVNK